MNKKEKMIETGIRHLKIVPDPNDVILYLQGEKWYNSACIIELTDNERDQLVEVLQKIRAEKETRKTRFLKKARMEVESPSIKPVGIEQISIDPKLTEIDQDNCILDKETEEFHELKEKMSSVKMEIARANDNVQRLKALQEAFKRYKEEKRKAPLDVNDLSITEVSVSKMTGIMNQTQVENVDGSMKSDIAIDLLDIKKKKA